MSVVKKIPKEDLKDFVDISLHAYPAFASFSNEDKERMLNNFIKMQDEYDSETVMGLYREDSLLGGMVLHDFKMNYENHKINAGGLGSVAVHYLHKKEKVAKELVEAYLYHYRERNVNLAVLYPFRTDFYKKMGFGYGTKMNHYKLKPTSFPKDTLSKNIVFLKEDDKDDIIHCYNEFVERHHGMMCMTSYESDRMFKNPKIQVVGYKNNGKLEGYVFYVFKPHKDNFLINDMVIYKMIYNSREALNGIFSIFYSQLDQIRYIIINTQDEFLHHMFNNPINDSNHVIPHVYHESNVQGIGLMYRVINIEGLFNDLKERNFNHVTCRLKLSITDDFIEENNQSYIICFKDGISSIIKEDDYEVEVNMSIAEFSSLVMGVVPFLSLYYYGLAEISDKNYIEKVNSIFKTNEKPICMTGF